MTDLHGAQRTPRSRGMGRLAGVCALGACLAFLLLVHPFLAITARVPADTLVIEGWVPVYVLDRAVAEIARGQYHHVFVSGMDSDDGQPADATIAARYLIAAGVAPEKIVPALAPPAGFNRTSHMARAVRDRLRELHLQPRGVNVITLGPHARQSRLAYRRLLGPATAVGVISVPKDDYVPAWWWLSAAGIKKTTKDFAGWLKELILGLRS